MPNYIKNKLVIEASSEVIDSIVNEFGTLIDLIEKKGDAYLHFPDFEKVVPTPNDPAYRDEPNQEIAKRSPNWWYNWNINNWGSKWNSGECCRISDKEFTFDTAWSHVPQIVTRISVKYPDVVIKYTWADEDTGNNCGRSVYKNGLLSESIPDSQSKEAYDIAFELRPEEAYEYKLVDGNYVYNEE